MQYGIAKSRRLQCLICAPVALVFRVGLFLLEDRLELWPCERGQMSYTEVKSEGILERLVADDTGHGHVP